MTKTAEQLLSQVRNEAQKVEAAMDADLLKALVDADPLLDEVLRYALFGGGKRMRPVLAIFSHQACNGHDPDIYLLAAAFEYLHVATLLHDDVIDNAGQRRGRTALCRKYSNAAAILAGDWLHSRSALLIAQLAGQEGLEVFSASNSGMVDGEFLQLRHTADPQTTETDYFNIIHRKTGLLIASTCRISALFSNAPIATQKTLFKYGLALGEAFQVIDDLLDYAGDKKKTGKAVGNDFIEGKMTLPLIYALENGSVENRQHILSLLGEDRTDAAALSQLQNLLEETGGMALAMRKAQTLIHDAVAAVKTLPQNDDCARQGIAYLCGLADYVIQRDR